MQLDKSQLHAVEMATNMSNRLTIITGGAGTGKTSTIKAIVEKLPESELMSSTGKASARLSEVTGKDASTIHRALGFDGECYRRRDLFQKSVIIDEFSMVDSALMAKILEYKPPHLILVGDDSQLQPVGRGCPFTDLIRIKPESVARLTTCHRAKGSIHIASQAIREGRAPFANHQSDGESFKLIETGDSEHTTNKLLKWVKEGFFNPQKDMILSPRYGQGADDFDGGIDSLNKEIKTILNPSIERFAKGDRIIVTKNHTDLNIFNGDLGFIVDIDSVGQFEITLDRDKKNDGNNPVLIRITKDLLKDIKLAYCLSVHKAQGSEAEHVFFVCLNSHYYQLNRSLVYTGITRAKKACVVIGQLRAFYAAINKVNEKRTILQYLGKRGLNGVTKL